MLYFIDWYNNCYRHGSIKYVTPTQRHPGYLDLTKDYIVFLLLLQRLYLRLGQHRTSSSHMAFQRGQAFPEFVGNAHLTKCWLLQCIHGNSSLGGLLHQILMRLIDKDSHLYQAE